MDGQSDLHANLLFEAVRVDPAKGEGGSIFSPLRAIRGRFGGAEPPAFTYAVLDPEPCHGEKRAHRRTRTRLRTGKLVDGRDMFLTECRFQGRSRVGARLELLRAVDLPDGLRLFEDETGLLCSRSGWSGGTAAAWASPWTRLWARLAPRSGAATTRSGEPGRALSLQVA